MRLRVVLLAGALLALAGCQTKPTVARDNPERRLESAEQMLAPIQITQDTIVLDARPRFDFAMAHVPKSLPIQWWDYTEPEPAQRGVLQGDLFAAARRLARLGISPESKVVVVGKGREGDGEEGRVAWMLAYLGVRQVQFASLDSFKFNLSNVVEEPAPKQASIWKPEPIESLVVTRPELQHVINKRGVHEPIVPLGGGAPIAYRIIDVRSSRAYLGREGLGAKVQVPNMDAMNIPWKEFFTADLRPNPAMKTKLLEAGLDPNHRLIVLDENGVTSGAVTMALRALGFERAGNYSGGLIDLMSAYGR